MLARTDSRARALVLLIVVALTAAAIGARLVWWQVAQQDWLASMALRQLSQQEQLPAERGEITDVNGELLATSVELQSVFATPPTVEEPGLAARGYEIDSLAARLADRRADQQQLIMAIGEARSPAEITRRARVQLGLVQLGADAVTYATTPDTSAD